MEQKEQMISGGKGGSRADLWSCTKCQHLNNIMLGQCEVCKSIKPSMSPSVNVNIFYSIFICLEHN